MEKLYVDFNATTPLDSEVVTAVHKSLIQDWGNPSSNHDFGQIASLSVDIARSKLADMVGGKADEITFTSGGTEVNNMVIFGVCSSSFHSIPHVITSSVEHDSIDLPLKHLEDQNKIKVSRIKLHDGELIAQDVIDAITDETVLITIMAANNETGVIMPLEEIGEMLNVVNHHRVSRKLACIIFHSDGAQIIGKEEVDVVRWNLDCFTIVGHKFYGPRIGALWSRCVIAPLLFGGGQEKNLRPGTLNTPMIVGLGVAAELVAKNINSYKQHFQTMREELERLLTSSPILKAVINCGEKKRLANTVNVSFQNCSYSGKLILANCKMILAGVGAACHSNSSGSPILLKSGVPPSLAVTAIRLSLGRELHIGQMSLIVEDLEDAFMSLKHQKMKGDGREI